MILLDAGAINVFSESIVFYPWQVLLLAAILALGSFGLQGRYGINVADEGFLWYGVRQTALGQVPLRDFQAYDPGRYYWSAAVALVAGNGLLTLRFSQSLFQIIGLWAGLMAAGRVVQSWPLLIAVGLMLTLWMFPAHKLFDGALLLMGIWVAVRLVEEPLSARIFTAGLFVGLCVFFGRNHALYNFLAQACLLLLLHFKLHALSGSQVGIWLIGIAIGLIPIIAMFAGVPGFFSRYIESVHSIFRHGTNLALPVPWPWRVAPNSVANVNQFLLGTFFIALPLFYVGTVIALITTRSENISHHALLAACVFLGLFYLHHAFSRADFSHLAQIIHPFLLGSLPLLGFLDARKASLWFGVAIMIAAGIFSIGRLTPVYKSFTSRTPWIPCNAGGKIFVPPSVHQLFTSLRGFVSKNVTSKEGVLIAPFTPALYPILERESPLWDLAFYFPATAQRQQAMVRQLEAKNVTWAIISEMLPDKRADLRFSVTHKLVGQYLAENFDPIECEYLPQSTKIFHRRERARHDQITQITN